MKIKIGRDPSETFPFRSVKMRENLIQNQRLRYKSRIKINFIEDFGKAEKKSNKTKLAPAQTFPHFSSLKSPHSRFCQKSPPFLCVFQSVNNIKQKIMKIKTGRDPSDIFPFRSVKLKENSIQNQVLSHKINIKFNSIEDFGKAEKKSNKAKHAPALTFPLLSGPQKSSFKVSPKIPSIPLCFSII
jgi:hypothetical protein